MPRPALRRDSASGPAAAAAGGGFEVIGESVQRLEYEFTFFFAGTAPFDFSFIARLSSGAFPDTSCRTPPE
ncbi:hypothetical protein [Luteolibacter marinus]|uniref:hypothetical protein n=1 Tax=Luteolibacter marinus TaxID=2776705 RepID=UPI0018686B12|nr:hypothetical protein [Luteolibacter marinus]